MIPQFSVLPVTRRAHCLAATLICVGICGALPAPRLHAQATMTIDIVDDKSGEPIPCRIELRDAANRPQKTRGAMNRLPWSVVDGQFVYKGRAGDYQFDVFHGPEYASGGGGFTLDKGGEGDDTVRLPRYANMRQEGWFAGDMLTAIPRSELRAWLPAEGLMMAAAVEQPVQLARTATPPNQSDTQDKPAATVDAKPTVGVEEFESDRWCDYGSYFDDRPGSGLVLHHWLPPAPVPDAVPSSRLLVMAKQQPETHAEIARLWARDVPIWLASGRIDSIQVLAEHTTRDGRSPIKLDDMFHTEPAVYKGARGTGRLVENIYWQVLEAGLRIPPSAGSGVGKTTSPLGYNRVYVSLGTPAYPSTSKVTDEPGENKTIYRLGPEPTKWWEALRAGRSFVTNGPLLRAKVNGELPGKVFDINAGTKLTLDVALDLTVADPVEYVDVIFNGDALYHARLDEYAKQGGKIPALEVSESGWLVVRVVTGREETYRIATTAPYYFNVAGQPRISRAACEFFIQWLERNREAQQQSKNADPVANRAAEPFQTAALEFWKQRAKDATQ